MIGPEELLLLDTSVLVDLVVGNASGKRLLEAYALDRRGDRPLISVVTQGELFGVAALREWGPKKIAALDDVVRQFVVVDLVRAVVDAYAELTVRCKSGPTMGQNDMWIAASAKAADAVLLTQDKDFRWLHPTFVRVEYVERKAKGDADS